MMKPGRSLITRNIPVNINYYNFFFVMVMVTKAELEGENRRLRNQINSLIAERAVFQTEILRVAVENDYIEIVNFINPTPEEMKDLMEGMV